MYKKIYLRLFKKKLIKNYKEFCAHKRGHALLYFKTDPMMVKSLAAKYVHTNLWEVLEISKILNKLGYWVDVLDRDISAADLKKIEDKYDIFIGLGAGNSGKFFSDISAKLTKAVKIFYACGPEPEESNRLIFERYEYFNKRHPGNKAAVRRLITKVNMAAAIKNTDVIFCIGNDFSIGTYAKFNKPIYRINPSTSPNIKTGIEDIMLKNKNKFLYFGGNGNIVKGLDLAVEVFSGLPELDLYACSPREEDFDEIYKDLLERSKNIHFMGFIDVAGKKFNDLTKECGFVLLPSCSEGIATSVVTCIRKGLVPVVTKESGIDLSDFGFLIESIDIEKLKEFIVKVSNISDEDFKNRVLKTYSDSFKYTQAKFSEMFELALIDVILKNKQLNK
jgi:glycosyltransferase involved in cell wall biosynthesis